MADNDFYKDIVLESDEEPLRLERQAKLYGFKDDRKHLSLSPTNHVLDAGCGPGAITRAIAREVPNGKAYGVDRDPKYIDFARRKAASENIGNIQFEIGDVLKLPFESDSFDIVWSKHLLQFVRERNLALAEFKRVLRPGGRIVCCNYDGFCAQATTRRTSTYNAPLIFYMVLLRRSWESIIVSAENFPLCFLRQDSLM